MERMTIMTKDEIIAKVKETIEAPSCCADLKKVGAAYLKAVGTADEAKAAEALKKELKADVNSIDAVIPFFGSEDAKKLFGAAQAEGMYKAAKEAKAKGVKYCICPACTAGGVLLDHIDEF